MAENRILKEVSLPDGSRAILYDWMDAGRNNLIIQRPDGERIKPEPPFLPTDPAEDCFVSVDWNGESLIAHSYSCYRTSIDPLTGQVTILAFTK
jgi:hypothetical protein